MVADGPGTVKCLSEAISRGPLASLLCLTEPNTLPRKSQKDVLYMVWKPVEENSNDNLKSL